MHTLVNDECRSKGAGSLAIKMLEIFGENAFTMLVDEGGGSFIAGLTNTMNNGVLVDSWVRRGIWSCHRSACNWREGFFKRTN